MRKPFDGDNPLTQKFNDPKYRYYYSQFGLLGHNGLDYGLSDHTPVLAPHAGVAREVLDDPNGYGHYVKIENGDETSVLAHLSEWAVKQDDQVSEGQLIGYSGSTGYSTGPHLHWGYFRTRTRNRENGFNGYIDQTDWLDLRLPPSPPTPAFSPQTLIPLGELGEMELQAVVSEIRDRRRDVESLTAQLGDLSRQLGECLKQQDLCVCKNPLIVPSEAPRSPENPNEVQNSVKGVLQALSHFIHLFKQLWKG